jgi:RimJ/RimL family protein N-acetyltransferase
VQVWACDGGVMVIGRGLAGRWEVGVEVSPPYRGKGLGRAMAEAATHLVPGDRPIWAQIAPGNAASLRAFLAAGYLPVGQEALLVTHGGEGGVTRDAGDPTRPAA